MLRQLVLDEESGINFVEDSPFYEGRPLDGIKQLPRTLGISDLPDKKRFGMKIGAARRRLPRKLAGKVLFRTPGLETYNERFNSFEVMYGMPFTSDDDRPYDEQLKTSGLLYWNHLGFACMAKPGSTKEERTIVDRLGRALTQGKGRVTIFETHSQPFVGAAPIQHYTNFPNPGLLVFIGDEDKIPRDVREKSTEQDLFTMAQNTSELSMKMDEYADAFRKMFTRFRITKIWKHQYPELFPDALNPHDAPLNTMWSGAFWVTKLPPKGSTEEPRGFPRSIEDIIEDLVFAKQEKMGGLTSAALKHSGGVRKAYSSAA